MWPPRSPLPVIVTDDVVAPMRPRDGETLVMTGVTLVAAKGCSWNSGQSDPPLSSLGPQYMLMLSALWFVEPTAIPLIWDALAVAMELLSVHQVGKSPVTSTGLSVQELTA